MNITVCDASYTRVPPSGWATPEIKVGEPRPLRLDERSLVRGAQEGDTAAFEKLVHQYDRVVLCLAIRLTGSREDGQDIYQEAFLRAYKTLSRFRFECSFYTWIYRIVTNLCIDYLRKKKSRGPHVTTTVSQEGEEEELVSSLPDQRSGASPERRFVSSELRDFILRAMQALTPRERAVFELKHYHGLRLRAVAGILNTTEGTVKNALFRATQKLRSQLAEAR